MIEAIFLLSTGFFAGLAGSIAGIGGGIIIVPVLFLLLSVPHHDAAGTSLVVMVFIAISAVFAYKKQQRIDYRSGFLFLMTSIPGSLIGSYLSNYVSSELFSRFFGLVLIVILLLMTVKVRGAVFTRSKSSINREFSDVLGIRYQYQYNYRAAMVVTFAIGLISSLFGIGGGVLLVPSMVVFFSFPPHIATATSMFVILVSSFIGSVAHMTLGHVVWEYVILLAPGAYFGGLIGARIARNLTSNAIIYILKALIAVAALRMLI